MATKQENLDKLFHIADIQVGDLVEMFDLDDAYNRETIYASVVQKWQLNTENKRFQNTGHWYVDLFFISGKDAGTKKIMIPIAWVKKVC